MAIPLLATVMPMRSPLVPILACLAAALFASLPGLGGVFAHALIFSALAAALCILSLARTRSGTTGAGIVAAERFFLFFLGGCIGLALFSESLVLVKQFLTAISKDYFSSLIDGREILKAWLLAHGKNIYPDMSGSPYIVTLYTPLFHTMSAVVDLFVHNIILSCHLVACAAFAGLFILCAVWIKGETGALFPALVTPGLMLTGAFFGVYGLAVRPDLPAWLLAYSSLFLFGKQLPARSSLALSAILVSAAMLTKQQTLPVFLACATAFVIRLRSPRACLRYALAVICVGLASFAVLQVLTDGNFITHAVVYPAKLAAMDSVTSLENAVPRFLDFFRSFPALSLLYLAFASVSLSRRKIHVLDWAIAWQLPFLVKLVSTWGADSNYFLGLLTAMYLRVGLGFGDLWRKSVPGKALFLAAAFLMIGNMRTLPEAFSFVSPIDADQEHAAPMRRAAQTGEILINAEGAPILLTEEDNPRLSFFDGTEAHYFDRAGLWRFADSRLAKDIAAKRFRAIILRATFFDPQLTSLVETHYALAGTYGNYSIFEPRPGIFVPIPAFPPAGDASGGAGPRLVESDGLQFAESFGAFFAAKEETAPQGAMVVRFDAPKGATAALLAYPKVVRPGPDDYLEIQQSDDGERFTPLTRYEGDGKDVDRALFEPRLETRFSVAGGACYLRFVFHGSAQLWTNAQNPMAVILDEPGLKN